MHLHLNESYTEKCDHDHELFYDEYVSKLNQQINVIGLTPTSHGELFLEILSNF